ncbi:MAG: response regulator [Sulfuricella sp.]|nr:response regulator [Sulfuricella sp.]
MNKLKILIVDDQSDLRKLLRMTLALIDCDVHEADSGLAAMATMRTLKPDVVILDVMLPGGIDGYQVCQAIKADPSTKKAFVLLLSARGQKSDKEEGRRVGADGYMVKPFSPLELIETIKTLCK